MGYNPVFQKIKGFVEQELAESYNISVREMENGYYVNSFFIQNDGTDWTIKNPNGAIIQRYHYARIAFLSAFAIAKNKTNKLQSLAAWDCQLGMLKHDVDLFITKLKNNPRLIERNVIFERHS